MKKIYSKVLSEYNEFMKGGLDEDSFRYNILEPLINDKKLLPLQDDLAILKKYGCSILSSYNVEAEEMKRAFEKSKYIRCLESIKNLEDEILPVMDETKEVIVVFEILDEECKRIKRAVREMELLTIKLNNHYCREAKRYLRDNELDKVKSILSTLELEIRLDESEKTDGESILESANNLRQLYDETAMWETLIQTSDRPKTIYRNKIEEVLKNIKAFVDEGRATLAKRLVEDLYSISIDRKSFHTAYSKMITEQKTVMSFDTKIKVGIDKKLNNLKGFNWDTAAWLIIAELIDNVHEKSKLVYSKYFTI